MATETSPVSPAPWDLATGNKWTVHGDRKIDGDHNNEVVIDAKGSVVAYVSGFNDEGGNGSLLAAAPALRMEAQLFRCLVTSPRFQSMTVAEALHELAENGQRHDDGAALRKAGVR